MAEYYALEETRVYADYEERVLPEGISTASETGVETPNHRPTVCYTPDSEEDDPESPD